MKIAILCDTKRTHFSLLNYCRNLFSSMKKLGVDIEFLDLGIESTKKMLFDRHIGIIKYIKKKQIDILHIGDVGPTGNPMYKQGVSPFLVLNAKIKLLDLKIITTSHGIYPFILEKKYVMHWWKREISYYMRKASGSFYWKYIHRFLDAIISVSIDLKKKLITNLRLPKEKIIVIHHGVDREKFKPINKDSARNEVNNIINKKIPENHKVILHVSAYAPIKNVETLILAFRKILSKRKDIWLLLLGKGHKWMSYHFNNELMKERTIFLEHVPDEKIHYIYNFADLFVFPSIEEAFGMPLLEAMASGLPTIASSIPVFHEIGGKSILYFKPKDYNDLSAKILYILSNIDVAKHLGYKARERTRNFTWEKAASKTINLYKKIYHEE